MIAAVQRAQAEALNIKTQAKRRLADEYDAAQERGEVATQSRGGTNIADGVPGGNTVATAWDLGLTRKAIHEARQLRNAEAAHTGVIHRGIVLTSSGRRY